MGKIIEKDTAEIVKANMLDYFMNIMYDRSIADIRDGCKPIHRYVLWDMLELGVLPSKPHKKSARIVGDTIGKYSPHGDASTYAALVRLAQDFSLNVTMVDGHGK